MSSSGLLLSNQTVFSALRLATLDFRGTLVAVLSGCETGAGSVIEGDGIYGLRRGLSMAGVKTSVVTLWPVADREVAEFMAGMYARAKKQEIGGALNAEQAAWAVSGKSPYYWAAAMVSGPRTQVFWTNGDPPLGNRVRDMQGGILY
jgi:CHAT domain-containing protein